MLRTRPLRASPMMVATIVAALLVVMLVAQKPAEAQICLPGGCPPEYTPPVVTITSGPPSITNSTTADFDFSSSKTETAFFCKLDSAPSANCTPPPKQYTGLIEGQHTFMVYGVDNTVNHNVSAPVYWYWTVDTTAPTVDGNSLTPAKDAANIAVNTNVGAAFSEDIDSTTVTDQNFTLTKQGGSTGSELLADLSYDSATKKATLDPDSDLEANTTYTATITTGVKDRAGNALAQNYTWSFTTAPQSDTTAPVATAPSQTLTSGTSLGTSSTVPVKLSWSATDETSAIARYELQQKVDSGAYSALTLPSVTQTNITRQLTPGKIYTFQIRAQDAAGNWSDWKPGPTFKVNLFQEANSAIAYTGTWSTQSLTSFSDGGVKYASTPGTTLPVRSAKLTQTHIRNMGWVSTKGPNRGKAEVRVDGVKVSTPDLYASSLQYRKVVYVRNQLDPGVSHSLESRPLGTKNASSSGTRVDVDALVVLSSP